MSSIPPVLIAAALLTSLAACDISTGVPRLTTAPPLPPLQSIELDLSFFRERAPSPGSGSTTHWMLALDRIAAADSLVGRLLALPHATLKAASAQTPEYRNSAWTWSFGATAQGQSFNGRLVGGVNGAVYGWQTIVSAPARTPPLVNRVLVDGISGFHGGSGGWTVYDLDGAAGRQLATVQWAQSDQFTFGFTVGIYEPNSRLTYTRRMQVRELYYLHGDLAKRFRLWWDLETGRGAVSVADGDNQCWTAQQVDISCSSL